MRRMLNPKEVLPSTVEFDKDGNRTVGKDLKVDGKLKLKSLVSSTNPDGDITKELGGGSGGGGGEGGSLYLHALTFVFNSPKMQVYINLYTKTSTPMTLPSHFNKYIQGITKLSCSGQKQETNGYSIITHIEVEDGTPYAYYYGSVGSNKYPLTSAYSLTDNVQEVH